MSESSAAEITAFDELVRTRRSVRGFLDKRVPDDVMLKLFETARWSPSGTNVQPWHVCVASGAVRDEMREKFLQSVERKDPVVTDHAPDGRLADVWRERKRGCARALYGAMGIEWEDRQGRGRAALRNYELFDAPHVAFLCMHEVFGAQSAADVGMFAQTLMLAMTTHGIACCAQGTMRNYPGMVRETFGLEAEVKVLFGISFGYEDPSIPANQTRTERAPLAETVQFLG
jgi:nitroreductase